MGEEIYETAEKADLPGAAASVGAQRSALLSGLDPNTKLAIEVRRLPDACNVVQCACEGAQAVGGVCNACTVACSAA